MNIVSLCLIRPERPKGDAWQLNDGPVRMKCSLSSDVDDRAVLVV
jgi:hypothetical protein